MDNRQIILETKKHQKGVVIYKKPKFLFEGQPGGKWIGTSYFYKLLKESCDEIEKEFDKKVFFICPKTIIVQTDLFKDFMDQNNLWDFVYKIEDDEKIRQRFLQSEFTNKQKKELFQIIKILNKPIAVRSSSINEDAERVSFAGIFDSIFLANNLTDEIRFEQLENAIKIVYASQYFKKAKEFYNRLNILAGDERMAIMIQEVVGTEHIIQGKTLYYPELSFVSFSYNEYATDMVKAKDGFYRLALGLGVGTVEMEHNVSISINIGRPQPILGINTIKDLIQNSPKYFYAIELNQKESDKINIDKFIVKFPIEYLEPAILERHGTYFSEEFYPLSIKPIEKKYQLYIDFRKSINNAKNGINSVIRFLRDLLKENFEKDVDFEGAIEIIEQNKEIFHIFYPLQARFQVRNETLRKEKLPEIEKERILLKGQDGLGKGEYFIQYVVFVDPKIEELYIHSNQISQEISQINSELRNLGNETKYLLIVPGRFGTVDFTAGVRGDFSTISHANAIIEVINQDSMNKPSQGTHFFEDIRGVGMAYLYTKKIEESNQKKFFELAQDIKKREYCFILIYKEPLRLDLDKEGNYIIYY